MVSLRPRRQVKAPQRYSPVESVEDDYSSDDYDESDVESDFDAGSTASSMPSLLAADPVDSDDDDDDDDEEEESSDEESRSMQSFIVQDKDAAQCSDAEWAPEDAEEEEAADDEEEELEDLDSEDDEDEDMDDDEDEDEEDMEE
jgi:hypothetical protein